MVKQKRLTLQFFTHLKTRPVDGALAAITLLTFIFSWIGVFPRSLVETRFSRSLYPLISTWTAKVADSVPFAWLDIMVLASLLLIVACIRRRRWRPILFCIAVGYLVFFWSWGLNYHRLRAATKVTVDASKTSPAAIDSFSRKAAKTINGLYPELAGRQFNDAWIQQEDIARVRRVVDVLDGGDWKASSRIKTSVFIEPWFRVAGIDGMFNPIVHEPIIGSTLLTVEKPFVIAHELAHVRGYPDEGDANFIGLLATLMSRDTVLQYSGWINLWLYLRTPELDGLLDPGPRRDVQRIFERVRSQEIRWVGMLQTTILDWFLKANDVGQGVRSYDQIVVLAAGSQAEWDRFR